jgi:hypothetical protein
MVLQSMRLQILVPARVRAGEPVPLSFTVTNESNTPLTLHLTGRPEAFHVVVRRTGGEVVWRRPEGATIAMILRVETLAPGGSPRFEDVWSQRTNTGIPARAGDYTVTGELPTAKPGQLQTSPAALHIDP